MKLAIILVFLVSFQNSWAKKKSAVVANGSSCNSFFSDIDSKYSRDEAMKIVVAGESDYANQMEATIVDVLDTGKRFRCDCYEYLVKYKGKDGKFWIRQVDIRSGAVYRKRTSQETSESKASQ